MTKIKENIRLIKGVNGSSYYVTKRASGKEHRKAFNTLEEAEKKLEEMNE